MFTCSNPNGFAGGTPHRFVVHFCPMGFLPKHNLGFQLFRQLPILMLKPLLGCFNFSRNATVHLIADFLQKGIDYRKLVTPECNTIAAQVFEKGLGELHECNQQPLLHGRFCAHMNSSVAQIHQSVKSIGRCI